MSRLAGIATLAAASCFIAASALGQAQTDTPKAPAPPEQRSEPDRPIPLMTPPWGTHPGEADRESSMTQDHPAAGGGQDMRSVQEALRSKGLDPGPIDGAMGPRTAAALREFQKNEGLRPSGRPDRDTLSRLGINTIEMESATELEGKSSGR